MNPFIRVSETAQQLGVRVKMIQRGKAHGKISGHRTVDGHRRISLVEITRLITGGEEQTEPKQLAICALVSSYDQKKKGDLQRQIDMAKEYWQTQGVATPLVFSDVASGLTTNRPGLV